jgi:LPS-assembly protein
MPLPLEAQGYRPPITLPPPPPDQPNVANPNQALKIKRADAPPLGYFNVDAVSQETEGSMRHLRGSVRLESEDILLTADEIDYDEDTGWADARGHVKFESFKEGDKLQCSRAKYNLNSESGTFWDVSGTSPAKIQARPGILTTSNPFYFEGKWAERIEDRYLLYNGFVTDCKMPKPWWKLTAPRFDIIMNQRAIGYHSVFRLRGLPLFYSPAFYKSLKKEPRTSGFLTPNIGHSSLRGYMFGLGYYWAINRSYDALYRAQIFTLRGVAHTFDFRGKVTPGTDFNFSLYGVNDKGVQIGTNANGTPIIQKQGGVLFSFDGKSDLGNGWLARGQVNYLSSFLFRQSFTESFNESIFSESHSVGYITKHWDSYGFFVVADRDVEFQSVAPDDKVTIRKLPELDFVSREKQILHGPVPVWFQLDSSGGIYDRTEPDYQTRQFVDRENLHPVVSTAFSFAGFHIVPSFGIDETHYGSSLNAATIKPVGVDLLRSAREVNVELVFPPLYRIYNSPKWLGGEKLKHVFETRADYRYVNGIGTDFLRVIRFDDMDLLSDTNEIRFSVANRLFVKNKDGNVNEVLSWELWQSRYFDPTFGGAVIAGQRNVVASVADLTGYTFLDGPRNYSPVVSALRFQQKIGFEWRTDYDPKTHGIVNSTLTADARFSQYLISFGHNSVHNDPVLAPSSDQFRILVGYGNDKRKGFNAAFSLYYDYRRGLTQFSTTQVTYNTDCCGVSVQYRRFNIGLRDETQFRVAFAVSNVGSFGTLRKQERIF